MLAATQFGNLSEAESELLDGISVDHASADRSRAALRPGVGAPDRSDARTVRAALLSWVLTDQSVRDCHPIGLVNLRGARIKGPLRLAHSQISSALHLWDCSIPDGIVLRDARTRGIDLRGCTVSSLDADGLVVDGDMCMRDGFIANGMVRMRLASIHGDFNCSGGRFINPTGIALHLDRVVVRGSLYLGVSRSPDSRGLRFMAFGRVRLLGAHIGGDLACTGGRFFNRKGVALEATRVSVKGGVFLNESFAAVGEVHLIDATVGSYLSCTDGRFLNRGGFAISADRIQTGGNIYLNEAFRSLGEVRFLGASIGGDLECYRGRFTNRRQFALTADRARIKGSIYFAYGATSRGQVRMVGAQVGGDVDLRSCRCWAPDPTAAIDALRLVAGGSFCLDQSSQIEGGVLLISATVRTIADCGACWPRGTRLDNFQYGAIDFGNHRPSVYRRQWLTAQPEPYDLNPQPYRQLAAVLRTQGYERDAREIMEVYWWNRLRREARIVADGRPVLSAERGSQRRRVTAYTGKMAWIAALMVYGILAGFGYARWRAAILLVLMYLTGVLAFERGRMQESQPLAMRSRVAMHADATLGQEGGTEPDEARSDLREHEWLSMYPSFNRWVYSADVLIPFVALDQESYWTPHDGWARAGYLPLHIAMGWLITSAIVVSFTSLMHRPEGG